MDRHKVAYIYLFIYFAKLYDRFKFLQIWQPTAMRHSGWALTAVTHGGWRPATAVGSGPRR
jgi:hypothetical protein